MHLQNTKLSLSGLLSYVNMSNCWSISRKNDGFKKHIYSMIKLLTCRTLSWNRSVVCSSWWSRFLQLFLRRARRSDLCWWLPVFWFVLQDQRRALPDIQIARRMGRCLDSTKDWTQKQGQLHPRERPFSARTTANTMEVFRRCCQYLWQTCWAFFQKDWYQRTELGPWEWSRASCCAGSQMIWGWCKRKWTTEETPVGVRHLIRQHMWGCRVHLSVRWSLFWSTVQAIHLTLKRSLCIK